MILRGDQVYWLNLAHSHAQHAYKTKCLEGSEAVKSLSFAVKVQTGLDHWTGSLPSNVAGSVRLGVLWYTVGFRWSSAATRRWVLRFCSQ